jgi:hypothetical protein
VRSSISSSASARSNAPTSANCVMHGAHAKRPERADR